MRGPIESGRFMTAAEMAALGGVSVPGVVGSKTPNEIADDD
jgi:hypothetical protein